MRIPISHQGVPPAPQQNVSMVAVQGAMEVQKTLLDLSKVFIFYNSLLSVLIGWYYVLYSTGLPRSGKNTWKMKFFPGQGKVGEFCKWPGKFRKDFESQRKVREFEMAMSGRLRKFIYFVQRGEKMYCLMR